MVCICIWGNWGSEKLGKLSKFAQLTHLQLKDLKRRNTGLTVRWHLLSHFSPHFWTYLMCNTHTRSFVHLLSISFSVVICWLPFQMTNHIFLIAHFQETNKDFHFQILSPTPPQIIKIHLIKEDLPFKFVDNEALLWLSITAPSLGWRNKKWWYSSSICSAVGT